MTTVINQPNLVEGLTLLGWRLKRDAEIREHQNNPNFECEVEPTSTSYAALENISAKDDDYNPYAGLNIDLCLEVDAIDLNSGNQPVNDDYDPYEVFMKMNTRRTTTGRDRAPLAVLPSHAGSSSALVNNYRNYNFAEDDTPVKYPLAIGHVDRRVKQPPVRGGYTGRPSFEEERRARGGMATRPIVQSTSSSTSTSYRSNQGIIPRRGVPASLVPSRGNTNQMRRNIPPPPRLYPRSEYPPSASSKRVTFRQSNDYNSGDDFEDEEEDDDSLEGDLHQPMTRRNKLPRRTAARIAVQRFRSNNIRSALADDDLDDDIAPTVTEMDMLEDQDLDEEESNVQTITKSMSSPVKLPPPPPLLPTKSTGGSSKSSYIGNMLPSFYEQLPESKKMLLQDATIDSSSNNPLSSTNSTTNTEDNGKTSIEMASPGKKQAGLTTELIQGPGGEEIIDEENRLQFRNTTISQPYKRSTNNNYQNSKRYYDNEEDDDQQQGRKRARVNDDDYGSSGGNQRQSQYSKQNRYRKYEDDDEYDINQDAQQQQQQEEEFQQTIRLPARRGRPPSQHHQQQEDPKEKYARIKAQFEEQHGLVLGEMRVFAPKLRLRISSVNVNWINLPPIPKYPHKVHQS